MRLVLASNNAKKLAELQALLRAPGIFSGTAIELVTQGSLGIPEAEEPHLTFIENALAKARHAARESGGAALADDSGLCVDALGGAPGVISAHYAPAAPAQVDREATRRAQDSANNALLLQRMQGLDGSAARRASFVSTLVALRHAEDPQPLVAVGHWTGEILTAPRGTAGFGYDPLMFIPTSGLTVAEMGSDEKNRQSHRARSAAVLLQLMRTQWQMT